MTVTALRVEQYTSSLEVIFTVTRQPFRNFITTSGVTLAERYDRTLSRLHQITRSGYLVKVQWECDFDESGIVKLKLELLTHPIVQQSPLHTRDALYEAMCFYMSMS